jgi:hypothetical protein
MWRTVRTSGMTGTIRWLRLAACYVIMAFALQPLHMPECVNGFVQATWLLHFFNFNLRKVVVVICVETVVWLEFPWWAEHVARMGKNKWERGSLWGKRKLGGLKRRGENSIKVKLKEMGWGSMDSINLAQDTKKWWWWGGWCSCWSHKIIQISWRSKELLASPERLCCL